MNILTRRERRLGVRVVVAPPTQKQQRFSYTNEAPTPVDDKQQPCLCGIGPAAAVDCCTGKGTGSRFGRPLPFEV